MAKTSNSKEIPNGIPFHALPVGESYIYRTAMELGNPEYRIKVAADRYACDPSPEAVSYMTRHLNSVVIPDNKELCEAIRLELLVEGKINEQGFVIGSPEEREFNLLQGRKTDSHEGEGNTPRKRKPSRR